MRTEKIKDNPTRIEELEWLLKCAKHYEAGGKIRTGGRVDCEDGSLRFICGPGYYEIVLEPKYRPYETIEEVPVGSVIVSKEYPEKYLILRSQLSNEFLWIYTHGSCMDAKGLFDKFTHLDGSPLGVEV